jgi:16S rRNA (guanine966-N2)-methyltransferase
MRIISGKYKGKRLVAPKTLPVRPTTDFAKEALFNILNHRISFSETEFLDLFAGTGNISFEMASRGATVITAVDADFGCVKYIQKISNELDFGIQAVKADVLSFLKKNKQSFDLIFADPPYDFTFEQFENIITPIFENNLIKPDGFLVIEHSKHTDLSSIKQFSEERKYGGSKFSFFIN